MYILHKNWLRIFLHFPICFDIVFLLIHDMQYKLTRRNNHYVGMLNLTVAEKKINGFTNNFQFTELFIC